MTSLRPAPSFALVLSALLALCTAQAMFDPQTPIETVDGNVVPLENCLFKDELHDSLAKIKREMLGFGISRPVSKGYCDDVENNIAVEAAANHTVVCISSDSLEIVGRNLGEIILDYLGRKGPTKRSSGGARGGRAGTIDWGGGEMGESGGPRKCCKCDVNTEYVHDGGSNCPRGPCCPQLCRSLVALGGGHKAGVGPCCLESPNKCQHQREDAGQRTNAEGGRSKGRFT